MSSPDIQQFTYDDDRRMIHVGQPFQVLPRFPMITEELYGDTIIYRFKIKVPGVGKIEVEILEPDIFDSWLHDSEEKILTPFGRIVIETVFDNRPGYTKQMTLPVTVNTIINGSIELENKHPFVHLSIPGIPILESAP